jgi:hypothetical protein
MALTGNEVSEKKSRKMSKYAFLLEKPYKKPISLRLRNSFKMVQNEVS